MQANWFIVGKPLNDDALVSNTLQGTNYFFQCATPLGVHFGTAGIEDDFIDQGHGQPAFKLFDPDLIGLNFALQLCGQRLKCLVL